VPASKLFFQSKFTKINKKTTLNNIQILVFSSGSWLQSRCQTYALRLRQTAHYGVGDGTYGCRWLSNLRPGPSLHMRGNAGFNDSLSRRQLNMGLLGCMLSFANAPVSECCVDFTVTLSRVIETCHASATPFYKLK
jgi:hypothetical protein